jgi:hypothetical protein
MGKIADGTMSGVWFGGGAVNALLLAMRQPAQEKLRSGFENFRL